MSHIRPDRLHRFLSEDLHLCDDHKVFKFSDYEMHRMRWKNLSPVIRTEVLEDEETGCQITIDTHADGRCTITDIRETRS